jgi:3-isopropylmalate dehydrogenase
VGHPKYDNDPDAPIRPEQGLLAIRKALQLFANIRPITIYDKLIPQSPLKADRIAGVDIAIYRELTGGIYFGEKSLNEDKTVASDLCTYSVQEIEQITHMAFTAAQNRKKKVTLVDKANVLETSRLWRRVVTEIAKGYPDVALDFLFVDNAAMQLILNPKQFDVMLTENMFGDILSDEASVIGGSIGLAASASVGKKYSLFEPIHGSYPAATGKGIANPVASILSAALLLEHFNLYTEASAVKKAVATSIEQNFCTSDIYADSPYSTSDVGSYIESLILGNGSLNNSSNVSLGKSTII